MLSVCIRMKETISMFEMKHKEGCERMILIKVLVFLETTPDIQVHFLNVCEK